jgi:hypothetical protein
MTGHWLKKTYVKRFPFLFKGSQTPASSPDGGRSSLSNMVLQRSPMNIKTFANPTGVRL